MVQSAIGYHGAMMLTRDALLNTDRPEKVLRLPTPELAVEGIGDYVCLRMLSSAERIAWQLALSDDGNGKPVSVRLANLHARFAATVLCNERGVRLFEDKDADKLGQLPAVDLERIYWAGIEFNRMREEDVGEAKKNLPPIP